LEIAFQSSIIQGGKSFVTGVITAQILRSQAAAVGVVAIRSGVKEIYKTQLGKVAIEKIAQGSLGKAVYGASAVNHVAKLLRTNAVAAAAMTAIFTLPDFYNAFIQKNMSWKQFTKNLITNSSATFGGIAGASFGAAIGTASLPVAGSIIGGIIGGIIGAASFHLSSKYILDMLIEDDAKKMVELIDQAIAELAYDYLLTKKEINKLLEELKKVLNHKWLKKMYKYGQGNESVCKNYAKSEIRQICERIIRERSKVTLPNQNEVFDYVNQIIKQ